MIIFHSPQSCGRLGIISKKKNHDSRLPENRSWWILPTWMVICVQNIPSCHPLTRQVHKVLTMTWHWFNIIQHHPTSSKTVMAQLSLIQYYNVYICWVYFMIYSDIYNLSCGNYISIKKCLSKWLVLTTEAYIWCPWISDVVHEPKFLEP